MKQLKNMQIIGIDNGYGNLKTASGIFPASVLTFDHEPAYAQDLLIYDGKYHVIGSGHREFTPDMLVRARLRHVAGTQWGGKKYMSMKHLEMQEDVAG